MLLDDLVRVIELLKERIATHGASLRENETRTRMALIDPLLQALGWDVSNPEMVTPEYDVSGRKADYALLGGSGTPSATVEAKRLGEPLASHRMQMLNYSNASGVEYAGLTDGDKWELYEVFKRGQLEDRRILDVSIANTPVHEAALKLLLLWQHNLASGQPVAANTPVIVSRPDNSLSSDAPFDNSGMLNSSSPIQVQSPQSAAPQPEVVLQRTGLSADTPTERNWIPISNVSARGKDSPTGIRFPDTQVIEIKRGWTDTWFQVCEWLASTGRLTQHDCPIRISDRASRYLVHTTPYHSNDEPFRQERKTTTGLSVERQYEPRHAITNAVFLLEKFGVSPESVELRFE